MLWDCFQSLHMVWVGWTPNCRQCVSGVHQLEDTATLNDIRVVQLQFELGISGVVTHIYDNPIVYTYYMTQPASDMTFSLLWTALMHIVGQMPALFVVTHKHIHSTQLWCSLR